VIDSSHRIKALILGGSMGNGLAEEVGQNLRNLDPEGIWAVRSSAVAEDLPTASFAGQQDTFLNIPTDAVVDHVRRCWASYWNDRALAYRNDAAVPQLETGIAVVIQRMVHPEASGIMFTADPVRKREGMVIESSWGLGEAIASGLVSPDRFLCDPSCSVVEERDISRKSKGLFLKEGRTTEVDIEPERQSVPRLTMCRYWNWQPWANASNRSSALPRTSNGRSKMAGSSYCSPGR